MPINAWVSPGMRLGSTRRPPRPPRRAKARALRAGQSSTLCSMASRRRGGHSLRPAELGQLPPPRIDLGQRLPLVEPPVLEHVADGFRVANVLQRILIEHHEIRQLARLERPHVLPEADR